MTIDKTAVKKLLKSFDFESIFREELGWDRFTNPLSINVDEQTFDLSPVAQKRGVAVFHCPGVCQNIPERNIRLKIERHVSQSYHEHLIIFTDKNKERHIWQWVRRERGKTLATREVEYSAYKSENLLQKLEQLAIGIDEETELTVTDVTRCLKSAFNVEKVTKKFYDGFKKEHADFQKFIKGIKDDTDLQWYTSVMLNRLMFVYFIQKKSFLDGDPDYLCHRLEKIKALKGKDRFHSFYRYFLLRLFHEGLGKRERNKELEQLFGKIPYLNGGFFEVHQIEQRNADIDIPDKAFEKLFDFFNKFSWHLDERPNHNDNEINPDVVGYIFEKYINQKEKGAYYTKEDITEYISKNTIIPFLFSLAPVPGTGWELLSNNPDKYIYESVKHGIINVGGGTCSAVPPEIAAGINDVAKRTSWNRTADAEFGLPTETWREHVARRTRCLEIRQKLSNGEVKNINDLITYNLDIWQFARDVIVHCEDPEFLCAFWKAIEKVTVLDPTCGSGAFLFTALRILETLYEDCLERMELFAESDSAQFTDFRKVLQQIKRHPNRNYFILKSIILNNLYGVDIMDEAVEICKLRLFLKLAAQVETVDKIEPLPDIDFNIRAGNTLVGYVSLEQIRNSQKNKFAFDDEVTKIENTAKSIESAFEAFRKFQIDNADSTIAKIKHDLIADLDKLRQQLDEYLAGEYGIDITRTAEFAAWRSSHQPFHWFVEFYRILKNGGFDVIIGNPPYVEYSKVKKVYTFNGYATENCGNLYAMVIERAFTLLQNKGKKGMIIPHSAICTDRMDALIDLLKEKRLWLSSFDIRPSKLFDGVDQRLLIYILDSNTPAIITSCYHRWNTEFREYLFNNIEYVGNIETKTPNSIVKASHSIEKTILDKIFSNTLLLQQQKTSSSIIYYHNAPRYFIRIMPKPPYFWNEKEGEKISLHVKSISFENKRKAFIAAAALNSSLFYWWFILFSNCRDFTKREIDYFPLSLDSVSETHADQLVQLFQDLNKDFKKHKCRKECQYKATGKVIYDEYYPSKSKPIIDEIDCILAQHYGFTAEELDFIINYDIKYRMGGEEE